MALVTHTTTVSGVPTVETWDVDPFALAGLGLVTTGIYGGFMWIRKKVLGRGR